MQKSELKLWTTNKLKEVAKELHCSIYQVECYGVTDLHFYEWILEELLYRGYYPNEKKKLSFTKE